MQFALYGRPADGLALLSDGLQMLALKMPQGAASCPVLRAAAALHRRRRTGPHRGAAAGVPPVAGRRPADGRRPDVAAGGSADWALDEQQGPGPCVATTAGVSSTSPRPHGFRRGLPRASLHRPPAGRPADAHTLRRRGRPVRRRRRGLRPAQQLRRRRYHHHAQPAPDRQPAPAPQPASFFSPTPCSRCRAAGWPSARGRVSPSAASRPAGLWPSGFAPWPSIRPRSSAAGFSWESCRPASSPAPPSSSPPGCRRPSAGRPAPCSTASC